MNQDRSLIPPGRNCLGKRVTEADPGADPKYGFEGDDTASGDADIAPRRQATAELPLPRGRKAGAGT
jgi:hypothetical protein